MSADNTQTIQDTQEDLTPITSESGSRIEIWPHFKCSICQNEDPLIVWEETSYQSEEEAIGEQYYPGEEPCCTKCGSRIPTDQVDQFQPAEWKQPIYTTISGIAGLDYTHPAVKNIFDRYHGEPKAFITAPVSELKSISGIGQTFADKIHTQRATQYPTIAPNVDGYLYEFRGRRLRDVEPSRLARDLIIGFVDASELNVKRDEAAQSVLEQTTDLLRENKTAEFWKHGRDSEELEDIADQLV